MTKHWCAKKGTLGHIGQNDRKLTFFECKWCKNTKKMVGWSGLYNGNEQAQRCRGHPGLLHLQCTHQKIFNTTLISVLSLQILMLTALVVLVFNISAHCAGHLGQLVQCNDPAWKLKKKLKIYQQPCRSRSLISLASWSNIYLYPILCVILGVSQ